MSLTITTMLPPFTLNLWRDLQVMLSYDFMRQAFLAGTLLSIVCGLVGYFVVLRHLAFAGESLSDVTFTGALGGAAFGINPFISLLATTVIVALAMGGLGERLRGRDVAIGTVLSWVFGVGVFFLSLFTAHVSGTGTGFSGVTVLFGNILGISLDQLSTIALVSSGVVLVLVLFARPLLFASLDPDVAAAHGLPVRLLGLGFMVLLAITVSEATLAVGALLVFALLLLPAAIAYQVVDRPFVALGLAALLSIVFTWLGIVIGFYTGYPSSVCISLLAFLCYVMIVGGTGLRMEFRARRIRELLILDNR
ncbi:ABC transporter permease [Ktedonobacter sp. SOSP1-85]|uniref:metal ABC transporter permease n=1 Tax=Ktedonobacter sp. SOSP1-85 TaxID=2778367 RepID=UPI001916BF53|nr:metal ABC transporter permease [Ktedonobacter sp. SOSP1-85]GHO76387.1 ABC transporter permease [Ktedonobacter sp. SOSP1-85]